MTSASAPQIADESTTLAPPDAPRVKVIVTLVEGSDLGAALATVDRQVYEGILEVVVIGDASGDLPPDVAFLSSLEQAIAATTSEVDYLWILHSDARPRPDALSALVSELERNDASLGGSKLLLAGTKDELESIGSATDVFGDPYSGIDEGEIDLQQYDVVREVAFVSSVSMLVRRDLAQGLRGLDELLEPVAAGLDFSQRVRLAGGRVITVPSSEVYHQARCELKGFGWREEAGRLRAMLKAYRPITLLWVVPYDLMVSLVDSLGSLLLFRWRVGPRHLMSWLWNIGHLPSTVAARRRFHPVRSVGDEELFRFQSRGSVRLREVGSELSDRFLSIFDDDQALARGTRRLWSSPGIWGAILAALVVAAASWSIVFSGVPESGFNFPFEPPTVAFDRFLAGWNDSGLGSADAVHPSTGLTGLISFLWFGAEGAARTLATLLCGVLAVLGMGRLAGRLGYRGPGRYLSGLVILAGPGTALIVGAGSWLALAAAALLPWAVRSVVLHPDDLRKGWVTHIGWTLLWTLMLTAVSPVLGAVPLAAAVLWRLIGGSRSSLRLGLATVVPAAAVAAGFLYDDRGWLFDLDRRLGLVVDEWWPLMMAVAAIPLMMIEGRTRRLGLFGALIGFGALIADRVPYGGPGVEEAVLVLASFGAAILVAAALDRLSLEPRRLIASVGAGVLLLLSAVSLFDGRLGLPTGEANGRMAFASTLADEGGPGRILVVSTDRGLITGEERPGPGFWYRTLDGKGTTLDEVWLPGSQPGDDQLDAALQRIATGVDLRPGRRLGEFAIEWVVIEGPESPLDEVLIAQLDLVPTPLAEGARVFENPEARPLAMAGDSPWQAEGAGFAGPRSADRATLRVNYSHGWAPDPELQDWFTTVSAAEGEATFAAGGYLRLAPHLAVAVLALAIGMIVWGRVRR